MERDRDVSVGPDGGRRVLRIKRFIDGKWATEIVRDAAVIRAYIRRRQIIEDETTGADTLAPTGDIDRDARAKKRCVHVHYIQTCLSSLNFGFTDWKRRLHG
jgi:transcription initiation factor TFIID subunit 1